MKKDEIELSYHQGSQGEPMVNVKVYSSPSRALAATVEDETGMTGFADWYEDQDPESMQGAWDMACEDGFETATDIAGEVFGREYGKHAHRDRRVWTAGRSGGYVYVDRLPAVEGWDAIAVSRWSKFARIVRAIADDIPHAFLTLVAINEYAWECETFATAEAMCETVKADAMAELVTHVG